MNLVDLGIVAVLAVSALLGVARGFVREVLGVGAWVLAGWVALTWGPSLQPLAEQAIGTPDLAIPAAYIAVFLLALLVFSLLANVLGRAVRLSMLGGLDRTLGAAFGLVRGAALVIAAYVIVSMLPADAWPPVLQQARSLPAVYRGALWAVAFVPPHYRPHVAPPPGLAPAPGEPAPAGGDEAPTHA